MKRSIYRCLFCPFLMILSLLLIAGCQSAKTGDKPGEDLNPAMTEKQKAVILEHKQKAGE